MDELCKIISSKTITESQKKYRSIINFKIYMVYFSFIKITWLKKSEELFNPEYVAKNLKYNH